MAPRQARLGALIERAAVRVAAAAGGRSWIVLDYPPSALGRPAFGRGQPRPPALDEAIGAHRSAYRDSLALIERYGADLSRISRGDAPPGEPTYDQIWLGGLDAAPLYAFVRDRAPARYFEIGSGNSTLFAARAVRDGGLPTQILSIDPEPRADVDAVCDEVVRAPFETTDLARFGDLEAGDVLFLDSSHRVFTASDVTRFFLEVLPALAPGVTVGIHDIFLPEDYPPDWMGYSYSEQYLLAAWLLGGGRGIDPLLAAHFCSIDPELRGELEAMWKRAGLDGVLAYGSSFWFRTT